jgi:Ricin-type beta-trefoil lectin domain-like
MERKPKRRRAASFILATLAGLGVLTAVAAPAGSAQAPDASRPTPSAAAPGSSATVSGTDRPAALPAGIEASQSGFYRIRVRDTNERMETEFGSVDNGRRILSSAGTGTAYFPSHWVMVPLGNGLFSFVNRNSGRCLDVPFTTLGVDVVQWECHGGSNQQFVLEATAFGYFHIRASNAQTKLLEVDPSPSESTPPMQQWVPDGGLYQEFWFERV